MADRILVTGGAGYIGAHTCLELLAAGYDVTVVDNLSAGAFEALARVQALAGRPLDFRELDLRDPALVAVFRETRPAAVIHFAALKAVGESVEQPLRYYDNNVAGSLRLCEAMAAVGCTQLVFSSSATVYRDPGPDGGAVDERAPLAPSNPYGQTKAMMEQILADVGRATGWRVALLRYFNPVGAHASGRIGEDPAYPANLVPFVSQVAAGLREKVVVFGDDWPTPDGTGVRDYLHVVDLARAHLAALRRLDAMTAPIRAFNLGTGRGYSVLEVIEAFRRASGRPIPVEIGPRRAGDIARITADPRRAQAELGWRAARDLADMVASAWAWQQANPRGYRA